MKKSSLVSQIVITSVVVVIIERARELEKVSSHPSDKTEGFCFRWAQLKKGSDEQDQRCAEFG